MTFPPAWIVTVLSLVSALAASWNQLRSGLAVSCAEILAVVGAVVGVAVGVAVTVGVAVGVPSACTTTVPLKPSGFTPEWNVYVPGAVNVQ